MKNAPANGRGGIWVPHNTLTVQTVPVWLEVSAQSKGTLAELNHLCMNPTPRHIHLSGWSRADTPSSAMENPKPLESWQFRGCGTAAWRGQRSASSTRERGLWHFILPSLPWPLVPVLDIYQHDHIPAIY